MIFYLSETDRCWRWQARPLRTACSPQRSPSRCTPRRPRCPASASSPSGPWAAVRSPWAASGAASTRTSTRHVLPCWRWQPPSSTRPRRRPRRSATTTSAAGRPPRRRSAGRSTARRRRRGGAATAGPWRRRVCPGFRTRWRGSRRSSIRTWVYMNHISMHNGYRSTYNEVRRPHRVTWGFCGIGSSGLKLSKSLNSLGTLGW